MIELSVVIVNWNTQKLLKDCLTSVFEKTKNINFEVIVVDNDSTDGSVAMVKKRFSQTILIENKKNLGFAKANNQAIKKAKGKYVLLLNSDTKLKDNVLRKLVAFAKTKKDLGIVGPRLLNKDGAPQPSTAPFYTLPVTALSLFGGDKFLRRSPKKTGRVDWVEGSCFLVKRQVFAKIGFLDEKFFMYLEDMEFCYRACQAGFSTWFYPQAEVYHFVRGSSSESKQKVIWWIYEGLLHFYGRHFASWQLTMLKCLLRTKAALAWWLGILIGSKYLKKTYAKAFKMA